MCTLFRGGQGPKALQGLQDPGPTEALQSGPMWGDAPPLFGKNGSNRVSSHAKRVQSCGKLKHALQNWQQFVIFTKALKKVLKCENDRESQLNIR